MMSHVACASRAKNFATGTWITAVDCVHQELDAVCHREEIDVDIKPLPVRAFE